MVKRRQMVPLNGGVPLFRLFNRETGDHLYTTSESERDGSIRDRAYRREGRVCYVLKCPAWGAVPLYRLYSEVARDHFYTSSADEQAASIAHHGYRAEGDLGFVFSKAGRRGGTTPLFRLFHRESGQHFYTDSQQERETRIDQGYQDEGILGHVMTGPSLPPWSIKAVKDHHELNAKLAVAGGVLMLAGVVGGGVQLGGISIGSLHHAWQSFVLVGVGVLLTLTAVRRKVR
jgi:hypothetical protein